MGSPRELTLDETRAIAALRRLMRRWPKSLHLLTIGDNGLSVIDAELAGGDLHDGRAEDRGAVLAYISTPVPVHGVSG